MKEFKVPSYLSFSYVHLTVIQKFHKEQTLRRVTLNLNRDWIIAFLIPVSKQFRKWKCSGLVAYSRDTCRRRNPIFLQLSLMLQPYIP